MITCVTEAHVANAYTAIVFSIFVLFAVIAWGIIKEERAKGRRWPPNQ